MNISKSPEKKTRIFLQRHKKGKKIESQKNDVDTAVKKDLNEITMMKECLRNRFALKNKDKLHSMKF